MCGIVASFSAEADVSVASSNAMLLLAKHRGPDGLGTYVVPENSNDTNSKVNASWAILGHVRLAILDVSDKSAQPMLSSCRRYSIVFNGEIYNFRELRTELEQLGVMFRTSGDTEVLLSSLIKWGTAALNRLRGMFSFVFVDHIQRTAIAVRDRYGIKPLFYWSDGKNLHFASEIKQFSGHPLWSAKLNEQKALQFLLYAVSDFGQETLFRGVNHIPPGSMLVIQKATAPRFEIRKWWTPNRTLFTGSYQEAVEEYRNRFQRALSLHLRSDVEIASCLSGGLDSSAIVGSVSKWFPHNGTQHRTFTATSENSKINESGFARAVNVFTSTQGNETLPTSVKLWQDLDRLVWHQDEPFGSTSIFAQWCVFESMRDSGIKVALDGQGADEQLGGYNSFVDLKILSDFERGNLSSALRSAMLFRSSGRVSITNLIKSGGYRHLSGGLKKKLGFIAGIASQNAENWINPKFIQSVEIVDPFLINGRHARGVRELSQDMVDRINLPLLLRFEDRNSMAFGIEARVPFADHELMEFGLTLPEEFLIRDGLTKSVLRDAARECLPLEITARRDKIGFQTNEAEWLSSDRDRVLVEIKRSLGYGKGIFSENIISLVSNSLSAGSTVVPWRVLSFLRWMEVFNVGV